jgi:hypothetical protein
MSSSYSEFDSSQKLLALLTRERILDSMRAMADWLGEARNAARGKGVGYRDIIYFRDGSFQWLYPHSNAGEQINVFLFLHDLLGDDRWLQHAIEYADLAIADPIHGIYRGEHTEAHGLPWYWPDIGVYGGIYGMRFPAGFWALYEKTRKPIYEEYARLTTDVLVARQTCSGLVDAGWSPTNRWAEARQRLGSRIGYAMGTFAFMHNKTGEQKYADALDRLVGCFERMQHPDGSFFETYHTETAQPLDRTVKNHFLGYILNGLTDAYMITHDDRLLRIAKRLAEFVARNFYYRQLVPYCAGPSDPPANQAELDSPVIDPATGLFKLYRITNEPHYLDIALKLWWHYFTWQTLCPERPELHGAVVQGANPLGDKWAGAVHASRQAVFNPHKVAHVCIYYQNQYVLGTQQLMAIVAARKLS